MSTRVEDVVNRSLDLLGNPNWIDDIENGSKEATVSLRHYGPALRQLFRSAHWNFSRKRVLLTLLNDATGQTTAQQIAAGINPATVGTGTPGMCPWIYEYAWPIDCVKARFVPMTLQNGLGAPAGNIALPPNPLMSGLNQSPFQRQIPARFLVGTDAIPNLVGVPDSWDQIPDTSTTMGQGLVSQTVILTNQPCASLVYTQLITYPDQWDPLFTQAFVSLLASYLAMPLVPDRKQATQIRTEMISIVKSSLDHARVIDGDEGWTTTNREASWIKARNTGGFGGSGVGWDGMGVLNYSWEACSFSDGSCY